MSAVDGIDEFAAKLAGILKEKNAAYGDSFARVPTILAGMYQDVPPETLEGILFNARIQDKLGRIAQDPLAAGEDAYLDLAGYALLMANVQRLKRAAKAATEPTAPRTGVMFVGDDAVEYAMPAEASPPSEPNGRIKRDIWPFVVVHATKTGWYLKHTGWNGELFNAYAGGCWHMDERDATAFPSEEAAIAYLRRQAELNAVPPGGTVPSAEPKAEAPKPEPVVAPADCNRTERWLIRRTADGKLLQWGFTTREAADRFIANYTTGDLASALRAAVDAPKAEPPAKAEPPSKVDANNGVPSVVRTGSVLGRPHTSHRVSDDGWVVCRNGRYLNCHGNAWELFPDWGTQFPTKVGAECAARQIDPETGKWDGPSCE